MGNMTHRKTETLDHIITKSVTVDYVNDAVGHFVNGRCHQWQLLQHVHDVTRIYWDTTKFGARQICGADRISVLIT